MINLIQILSVVWHTQAVNDYSSIAATIAKSATRARTALCALQPLWQSLPSHTIAKHIKNYRNGPRSVCTYSGAHVIKKFTAVSYDFS